MSDCKPDLILEARNITKRYPGTIALDRVTFRVHRKKVNVLIGQNGAGKSTLMRVLAGVESSDEGQLLLEGSAVSIRSPREAAAHGISIVHQELSILPNLDISENIFAGRELVRAAIIVDRLNEDARSTSALNRLRKPMPVQTPVARLSLGDRQMVEIARVLAPRPPSSPRDAGTSALLASMEFRMRWQPFVPENCKQRHCNRQPSSPSSLSMKPISFSSQEVPVSRSGKSSAASW
jgi:erythritol transport system ATP-binding protein